MSVPSRISWFDAGPKTYWRGRYWPRAMVEIYSDAERSQGFKFYFYQGSWSAADASAGTHKKSGAGDRQSKGLDVRKRVARRGIVGWARTRAQGFMPHDHDMLFGDKNASPALKAQMYAWQANQNGLANRRRDDSGVRSSFKSYPAWKKSLQVVAPNCHVKAVNKSKEFGNTVRPYVSVKLVQTALNKIYVDDPLIVDGVFGPVTSALYDLFRAANFKDGVTGTIGAESLTLLFNLAQMKVNIIDEV